MLDAKRVGIKIAALRKGTGLSQEKLADLLFITPQAISKWENGHTLPETTLLPVLAQIFGCTIDEMIMPAYAFDEKIEEQKTDAPTLQAERIAKQVLKSLEGRLAVRHPSKLSDETIIEAVQAVHGRGFIGGFAVVRGTPLKADGNTDTAITVSAQGREFRLLERNYGKHDAELYRYPVLRQYTQAIPQVYRVDLEQSALLLEDLSESYIQGYDFNEDNENGEIVRANYPAIVKAIAALHALFWENNAVFEQIGLDWRLDSTENLLAHISTMEKDFKKYRKNETAGKIPATWEAMGHVFENHIKPHELDYFEEVLQRLKQAYPPLVASRFHAGKNITVIHGDLHPGVAYMSKDEGRAVKFAGLQAVRMGLCTEDLAMLIALHVAPDKSTAQPLLDCYYDCLCGTVKDYPREMFMEDYRIAVMESMFFAIRLINRGIYDFGMRDRAIQAFEAFVLKA